MADASTVGDYMTEAPRTMGLDQSVAEAAKVMHERRIRHLPVLHGGVLMGVLSQRDVAVLSAVDGLDPSQVTVEEAMTAEPFATTPKAPLVEAVREMADRNYGCAVVMESGQVVGILTSTDALRVLREKLEQEASTPQELAPSEVRTRVLAEHEELRMLLDLTEEARERVLKGGSDAEWTTLRRRARHLYRRLQRHMELENRILGPALRDTDSYGEVREEQLKKEHAEQNRALAQALMVLDDRSQSPEDVAKAIGEMVSEIRRDMAEEEALRLDPKLLNDDLVQTDFYAG